MTLPLTDDDIFILFTEVNKSGEIVYIDRGVIKRFAAEYSEIGFDKYDPNDLIHGNPRETTQLISIKRKELWHVLMNWSKYHRSLLKPYVIPAVPVAVVVKEPSPAPVEEPVKELKPVTIKPQGLMAMFEE